MSHFLLATRIVTTSIYFIVSAIIFSAMTARDLQQSRKWVTTVKINVSCSSGSLEWLCHLGHFKNWLIDWLIACVTCLRDIVTSYRLCITVHIAHELSSSPTRHFRSTAPYWTQNIGDNEMKWCQGWGHYSSFYGLSSPISASTL